jgi:hypothetical protein
VYQFENLLLLATNLPAEKAGVLRCKGFTKNTLRNFVPLCPCLCPAFAGRQAAGRFVAKNQTDTLPFWPIFQRQQNKL